MEVHHVFIDISTESLVGLLRCQCVRGTDRHHKKPVQDRVATRPEHSIISHEGKWKANCYHHYPGPCFASTLGYHRGRKVLFCVFIKLGAVPCDPLDHGSTWYSRTPFV